MRGEPEFPQQWWFVWREWKHAPYGCPSWTRVVAFPTEQMATSWKREESFRSTDVILPYGKSPEMAAELSSK